MTTTVAMVISGFAVTWEMLLLGGLLLSGIIYGFVVGRDRAVTVLLATYVSLAVVTNAPILGRINIALGISKSPWLTLFWFFGVFVIAFLILWRSALLRSLASNRGAWWETLLFSIMQIGLFLSIALYLIPPDMLKVLSFVTLQTFTDELGRSFWLLAPLVFLGILGGSGGGRTDDLD
jgi:hypothetical protein